MSKTFKIQGNDISDGFHTFDELYEHRCLLFLNLCLQSPQLCCYKQDYDEWFCLYMDSTCGQLSYHIPNKYLPLIEGKIGAIVKELDHWDGHTSAQVIERLQKLATNNNPKERE